MTGMPEAGLYWCRVTHQRLLPFRHAFSYRVFSLLVDLDALPDAARRPRLLRHNRFGLLSIHDRDHGPRDGTPLRPWVEAALRQQGLGDAGHRILLFCFPRLFGYVFNPLSVYYCYDAGGRLGAVLYEVKNTFGDQHGYLVAVPRQANGRCLLAQHAAKRFLVSPFLPLQGAYDFRILPPGETIGIVIRQTGPGGALQMVASQTGRRAPLTDHSLLKAVIRHPLMTVKVIAAIHWQALQLWRKGAAFFRWSAPPDQPVSAGRPGNATASRNREQTI
ncbi:DUF1365 domain-containing protein [Ferrovibrio sp.]|uniref:DUF1365 domain-containing protein n=1 Tax=Ferrovibrio sp. TaxID=1917215 RepID=UPI00311F3227